MSSYCEDDVGKTQQLYRNILDVTLWDKIDYILAFSAPIYDL